MKKRFLLTFVTLMLISTLALFTLIGCDNRDNDESYITLRYVGDGSELIGLLESGDASYGVLGEPAATRANAKTGSSTLFSIQDLWNGVTNTTGGFPQASVFINNDILDGNHDAFIDWFLTKLDESATWASSNASEASSALLSAGSASLKGLSNAMIQKCNIKIIRANSAKSSVNTYLSVLHGFDPQTVGGSIPNDSFYASLNNGATAQNNDDNVVINVCVPDGSPAIAIAKLLKDKPTYEGYTINYEIVTGANGIGPRLATGQATIAIAPTNAGATQFNKNNGRYKLAATAVQGALYMVGKGEISGDTIQEQLESLRGKTVYNIGQGATPDLTFRYILDYYNIPYRVS